MNINNKIIKDTNSLKEKIKVINNPSKIIRFFMNNEKNKDITIHDLNLFTNIINKYNYYVLVKNIVSNIDKSIKKNRQNNYLVINGIVKSMNRFIADIDNICSFILEKIDDDHFIENYNELIIGKSKDNYNKNNINAVMDSIENDIYVLDKFIELLDSFINTHKLTPSTGGSKIKKRRTKKHTRKLRKI